MTRTALVAGATGLVGSALLRRLLEHPAYAEIRVVGRRPPAAGAGRIRFLASDFADLAALAPQLGADDVYCCLVTTIRTAGSRAAFERVDHGMVVDQARAALAAGAKRFFVVSAIGASERSAAFYSRVKGRMEREVLALPFEAVHVLQPSLLLGARAEQRPGELAAQKLAPLLSAFLPGPLAKYRPIAAEDVAAAMVTLALTGARGAHRHALPLQATA